MPLYIDLHIDGNLTPDLVKKCHIADKEIQQKYGVRYLQVLLNEPQGHLFCLAEAPDKESCEKVHQLAHGNIACNVLEITESDFSALLANKGKDGRDFTVNNDGTLDTGSRAILTYSILGSPENLRKAREVIKRSLIQNEGRNGESFGDHAYVFESADFAIKAAMALRDGITKSSLAVELRMGLDIGLPLGEKGDFFEEVKGTADQLCFVALNGQLCASTRALQAVTGTLDRDNPFCKEIKPTEVKFLSQVLGGVGKVWENGDVTIADLAHELGLSKSQLTRKLKLVSDLSPNDFLKEFRLRQSIALIEGRTLNIAEISMAIGFSNAAYFAKCFRERFGSVPSHFETVA